MSLNDLTPKQRKRLQNKMKNEEQRLAKLQRKQANLNRQSQQTGSGLSKGQRRRRNRDLRVQQSALPKGLPVLPKGLPVGNYAASSNGSNGQWFPSGMTTKGPKTFTFSEDEYIQDVRGSDGFQIARFALNPGQSATFPWLSTIAKQFEKWRFHHLEFYYKPLVSGFATGGTTGKIMMSADFDATDPTPGTKQQVEDTYPHSDCMPYEQTCLILSPFEMTGPDRKFVRPGPVPAGADIRLYDGGAFFLSTQGNSGVDANCGELRVRYSVELSVPVLEQLQTPPPITQMSVFTADSSNWPNAVSKNINNWLVHDGLNPLKINIVDDNQLVFPLGNYLITTTWQFEVSETGVAITDISTTSTASELDYVAYQGFTGGTSGPQVLTLTNSFPLAATDGFAWIPSFIAASTTDGAPNSVSLRVIVQTIS